MTTTTATTTTAQPLSVAALRSLLADLIRDRGNMPLRVSVAYPEPAQAEPTQPEPAQAEHLPVFAKRAGLVLSGPDDGVQAFVIYAEAHPHPDKCDAAAMIQFLAEKWQYSHYAVVVELQSGKRAFVTDAGVETQNWQGVQGWERSVLLSVEKVEN
jgi:hypothetical protein